MIHGLDPSMEKIGRANFSFSTAQVLGFPRRSALYKHYAQADVTWPNQDLRIPVEILQNDGSYGSYSMANSSFAALHGTIILAARGGSTIFFYQLVRILFVRSPRSWPLPTWEWIKMFNTQKCDGLMPKIAKQK